jgi:hypothetical protein
MRASYTKFPIGVNRTPSSRLPTLMTQLTAIERGLAEEMEEKERGNFLDKIKLWQRFARLEVKDPTGSACDRHRFK